MSGSGFCNEDGFVVEDFHPTQACAISKSAVIGLWSTAAALYALIFLHAVRVSLGIWKSQELTLRTLFLAKPGTRTSFLIVLVSASKCLCCFFQISSCVVFRSFVFVVVDAGCSL